MLQGKRFLDSARFNRIIATLASKLDLMRPLRFLNRTPLVPAYDDELIGYFTGKVFAADIIADDQEAVTYETGQIEVVATAIPNLKLGSHIPQAQVNRMAAMEARGATVQEENAQEMFENRRAENLVVGVRQRMNAMICAMWLDDFQYDRLGVKIVGSFGQPADLKVTLQTPLTSTSANLVAAILGLNTYSSNTYGQTYNRVTMSLQAFQYWVATTAFAQLVAGLMPNAVATTGINISNLPLMQTFASQLLNMEIELEDATYNERETNGNIRRKRVMPANKIILSNTGADNDPNVMDFGNGIPTETQVAALVGNAPEGLGGEVFGPIGYYTGRDDLNPPDITAWAVARGFPRKHIREATAVITAW